MSAALKTNETLRQLLRKQEYQILQNMYRYRTLILTLLVAILANVLAAFVFSLLVKTVLLELSLLVFFLVLFSKRKDRKEVAKDNHQEGLKIYL